MSKVVGSISPYVYPGMTEERVRTLGVDKIVNITCKYYGVNKQVLGSKDRTDKTVEVRQMISLLIREYYPQYQLSKIGELFGNQHHATIIHHIKTIKKVMDVDSDTRNDYLAIKSKF